jgi:hypothetical protein
VLERLVCKPDRFNLMEQRMSSFEGVASTCIYQFAAVDYAGPRSGVRMTIGASRDLWRPTNWYPARRVRRRAASDARSDSQRSRWRALGVFFLALTSLRAALGALCIASTDVFALPETAALDIQPPHQVYFGSIAPAGQGT